MALIRGAWIGQVGNAKVAQFNIQAHKKQSAILWCFACTSKRLPNDTLSVKYTKSSNEHQVIKRTPTELAQPPYLPVSAAPSATCQTKH